MEEFNKSFTGICLWFAPFDAFRLTEKATGILDFAKQRLRGMGAAAFVAHIKTLRF